jgi:uncharacterized caspase-like protein
LKDIKVFLVLIFITAGIGSGFAQEVILIPTEPDKPMNLMDESHIAINSTGDRIAYSSESLVTIYSYPNMDMIMQWQTPSWLSRIGFSRNDEYLWTFHDRERYTNVRSSAWPRDSTRVWKLEEPTPILVNSFVSPSGLSYSADTTNRWTIFHVSQFRANTAYNTEYCTGSFLGKSLDGTVQKSLQLPSCAASEITSTDNKSFIIGHLDGQLTSWSTDDLSANWEVKVGEHPVIIRDIIQDSLLLITYGYKYSDHTAALELRNINTGKLSSIIRPEDWDYTAEGSIIDDIEYDSLNHRLVIVYDGFNLAVIDLNTRATLRSGGQVPGLQRLHDVEILPSGLLLIAGSPRQFTNEPARLISLDLELESMTDSRYFENTSLLAADTGNAIIPQIQFGHPNSSSSDIDGQIVGTSQDNKYIISKVENQLIIWDARSLKLLKRFKFKGEIKAVEITKSGLLLVAETTSTPFILEYDFNTDHIVETEVKNQRRMLSYERVFKDLKGNYVFFEQNGSAFYLLKIDGKTGEIIVDIHLDPPGTTSTYAFLHKDRLLFEANEKLYAFDINSQEFNDLGETIFGFQAFDDMLYLISKTGLKLYDPESGNSVKKWNGNIPRAQDYKLNIAEQSLVLVTDRFDGSTEYWQWNTTLKRVNQWPSSYQLNPYPLAGQRILWVIDKKPIATNGLIEELPEIPATPWASSLDLYDDRILTDNAIYSLAEANIVTGYSGKQAYFINHDSIVYVASLPESDQNYGTFHHYFVHKNLETDQISRIKLKKQPDLFLTIVAFNRATGLAATTASLHGALQIWDVRTGTEVAKFNDIDYPLYQQVEFNEAGDRLIVNLSRDLGKLEAYYSSYPFRKFEKIEGAEKAVFIASQDSVATDFKILNLETGDGRELYNFSSSTESYRVYSAAGNKLITGHFNGEINIWDLDDVNYKWNTNLQSTPIARMAVDGCLLATLSRDGQYLLIDHCKEKVLVSLYHEMAGILNNHLSQFSSVWLTPDNYYKSTKNAADLVHFVKENKAYSFDQFDLVFNRPDLVLQSIGMSDSLLIKSYNNAYIKRLQKMGIAIGASPLNTSTLNVPSINIKDSQRFIQTEASTVDVELTFDLPNGVVADRLILTNNNIPVYGSSGIKMEDNVNSYIASVPLSPGNNAIGFTLLGNNNIYSLKEEISVECLQEIEKPNLHLITVGISDYVNIGSLKYAAGDAREISESFGYYSDYFGDVKQHTLLNENATRENIMALKDTLENTNVNDLVILFFAGHGIIAEGLEWRYATYDFHPISAVEKGLTFNDIESIIDGIPAHNRLILVDACHSGELDADDLRAAKSEEVKLGTVVFRTNDLGIDRNITTTHVGLENSFQMMGQLFNDLRGNSGAVIISAAGGAEYAWESDAWENGVFTYSLLNGLKSDNADLNGDGTIMVSELKLYIEDQVQALTNGGQRPTSRQENLIFDFPILK